MQLLLFVRVNLLTPWLVFVWFLLQLAAHVTNVIFVPTKTFLCMFCVPQPRTCTLKTRRGLGEDVQRCVAAVCLSQSQIPPV